VPPATGPNFRRDRGDRGRRLNFGAELDPPSATVGAVDVTATTIAGTSATSKDGHFFYEGCVVPKLKGKKLKPARRILGRAHCKVGKVTRRRARPKRAGKVLKQSAKPGKVLASGSRVNLVLGKKSRAHR
jgi:hypothetical protein